MSNIRTITSVGIDVGTTTTHLTLSRLHLANRSRPTEPTRFVIERRDILYESDIYFTPKTAGGLIDAAAVTELLEREYAKADIRKEEIATGAAIITGQSARAGNAKEIIESLSGLAGQFVSALAGPNMESALAARGSGALEASRSGKVICNVDIGGGTSNFALCRSGEIVSTDCIDVGARACENVSDAAAQVADKIDPCDEIWFSGGVAELMKHATSRQFDDKGPLLAEAILNLMKERGARYVIPPRAIRATVIGAGTHALQLSGSTISVARSQLPLTNIPVFTLHGPFDADALTARLQAASELRWHERPVALFLPFLPRMGYADLSRWAQAFANAFQALDATPPLIVLTGHDVAAALGQLIARQYPACLPLVLDGIADFPADYLDIGEPLANADAVPVVLKEFVFRDGLD